jgi:hypothetical protein
MKRFIAGCAVCMALFFCVSCSNTDKCLQKYGYGNCEGLKKAFNLNDKDEAIRYHDIQVKCGCKD